MTPDSITVTVEAVTTYPSSAEVHLHQMLVVANGVMTTSDFDVMVPLDHVLATAKPGTVVRLAVMPE